MPSQLYDVIVVGAGPAGSYPAYELASSGYSVAVFEHKSTPGLDACCTGIVSVECFDSFSISPGVILTKTDSAKFFSPSGRHLRLESEKIQAYVVDRVVFDRAVAAKAQTQGAEFFFGFPVTDIFTGKSEAKVDVLHGSSTEIFGARSVVLANGFRPKLSQRLGLGGIKNFLIGAQAEVETEDVEQVEVYFVQQIAPGSFAWLVPISSNKVLAGLMTMANARSYLQKFLLSPFCQGRIVSQEVEIRQKAIPFAVLPRIYGDRAVVIGDAAGQVKPTSGGDICFGHLGTRMATKVLKRCA